MTVLLIILYILLGLLFGCISYVFIEQDESCIFIGLFWPMAGIIAICFLVGKWICTKIVTVLYYLKDEGFHYYKGDIENCCGKCKHMYYKNNHNEIHGCELYKGQTGLCSTTIPCERFKQDPLWRFRIRYKWDEKAGNK